MRFTHDGGAQMNVLVTGATGALGRHVVMQLRNAGHRARIFSRNPQGHVDAVQGDLVTGAGLLKAVTGMDGIIHAATAAAQPTKLRATDVRGTRRLLAMAREEHVRHVVYISIVGMEGVSFPYYKTKLAAEAVIKENIVPWTILRSTQFHTLMETFLGAFTKPPLVAAVPFRWQFQPVDPGEVATRLIEVATHEPAGMLPDFGGPEVRTFKTIAESWLKARNSKKRLINVPLRHKLSGELADGLALCAEHPD